MRKIELLSPAGNLDILKGAVDCGADAVYLGLSKFSARASATNFTESDLIEGLEYAHVRGSKIYVAVNTLMRDEEIEEALKTVEFISREGADGVIIQDIGLLKLINEYVPIPINASTQMNLVSDDDYRSLKKLGVTRIVLPRELSLEEIKTRVKKAADFNMETEIFAHGAVCVCTSGLCLFSSMQGDGQRSGNRGSCAQPCREPYTLENIRSGHILSPKDRDISFYLDKVIETGVASLKIEGRMRDKDYVTSAVKAYRELIDKYYDGKYSKKAAQECQKDLLLNFNRGGAYTSQYLTGKKDTKLLSGEYPGKYGLFFGKITKVDNSDFTISVSCTEKQIKALPGSYFSIRKNSKEQFSFPAGKIKYNGNEVILKGLEPSKLKKIEYGSEVYLMKVPKQNTDTKKTPVNIKLTCENKTVTVSVDSGTHGIVAYYTQDLPEGFIGRPVDRQRVKEQLGKLGSTPFTAENIEVSSELMCPVSYINELRRQAISELEDVITEVYKREFPQVPSVAASHTAKQSGEHTVETMYSYPAYVPGKTELSTDCDCICFYALNLLENDNAANAIDFMRQNNLKFVVALPGFAHDDITAKIRGLIKTYEKDIYAVMSPNYFCVPEGDFKVFLSPDSNEFNSQSAAMCSAKFSAISLSHELSCEDIISISENLPSDTTVIIQRDGLIPWMQSDFCPVGQNAPGCTLCAGRKVFDMSGKSCLPHKVSCSCDIYGSARNLFSKIDIIKLARNVNVIQNFTVI